MNKTLTLLGIKEQEVNQLCQRRKSKRIVKIRNNVKMINLS